MLKLTQLTGFNVGGGATTGHYLDTDIIRVPDVGRWQTSFSVSFTVSSSGFNSYTLRQMVPAGLIALSGPVIRLEIQGSFYTIDQMFIGEQSSTGDPYDMRTTPAPAQFRVGGNTTFSSDDNIGSPPIITDPLEFPFDEAKHYIITAHFPTIAGKSAVVRTTTGISGAVGYLKFNASEASMADVTGYSSNANYVGLISRIQVITNASNLMFASRATDSGETFGGGVITGGGGSDPNWLSVVFITGYEGAQDSVAVTDESTKKRGTGNNQGGCIVDRNQEKYGSASGLFNGTGPLRWSHTTDFYLGTSLFTIETFFYPTSISGVRYMIGRWPGTSSNGYMLYLNDAVLAWQISTSGNDIIQQLSGGTVTLNQWHHAAVDYDGTTYRLYLDGVMVSSSTIARNIYNSTTFLTIGANSNANNFFYQGYLDETRFTKDVARYASNTGFTPPISAFIRA